MFFRNIARLFTKNKNLILSNQNTLIIYNYPRLLTLSSVKMNGPKVLVTRPDIPAAGLHLLRERYSFIFIFLFIMLFLLYINIFYIKLLQFYII